LEWLGSRDWAHVLDWVAKNPDDVFPRVFPLVARLGDHGDAVSQQILSSAAASLGDLAACVLDSLGARERVLPIAKAGGTVGRSRYFDAAIDAALTRVAPRANVVALEKKPAEAAAHRARRAGHSQAHGG
jgi:N-acetylglucosamine kinase-like BadF-type ATPase